MNKKWDNPLTNGKDTNNKYHGIAITNKLQEHIYESTHPLTDLVKKSKRIY
jgi:hypothetical protein